MEDASNHEKARATGRITVQQIVETIWLGYIERIQMVMVTMSRIIVSPGKVRGLRYAM